MCGGDPGHLGARVWAGSIDGSYLGNSINSTRRFYLPTGMNILVSKLQQWEFCVGGARNSSELSKGNGF